VARRSTDIPEQKGEGSPSSIATEPRKHWIQAIHTNDDDALKLSLAEEINGIVQKHGLSDYLVLLLFDDVDSITSYHSDRIYAAASNLSPALRTYCWLSRARAGVLSGLI
jgi:hypothetical protein